MQTALIYFIKYPEVEVVKTRLGREIGYYESAEIYRKIVEFQLKRLVSEKYKLILCFSGRCGKQAFIDWLGEDFCYMSQTGGSLGERMYNAFTACYNKGCESVVVIGSDSPEIDDDIILEAMGHLKTHDCVIGPAADGGYYLLALKSSVFRDNIFINDIEWSGTSVFEKTIAVLEDNGSSIKILEERIDIDTKDDLLSFIAKYDKDDTYTVITECLKHCFTE